MERSASADLRKAFRSSRGTVSPAWILALISLAACCWSVENPRGFSPRRNDAGESVGFVGGESGEVILILREGLDAEGMGKERPEEFGYAEGCHARGRVDCVEIPGGVFEGENLNPGHRGDFEGFIGREVFPVDAVDDEEGHVRPRC